MNRRPSTMQSFFAEMKRRRVFRVMAVYGAVAFAALQLADLLIEPLGVPDWTMRFLLLVALVGFPIAMVLAWAFETTPDGVRRTVEAQPEEIQQIISAPRSHRWPAGLLALAGMTLLFATGWWMGAGRDEGGPAGALVPEVGAAEIPAVAALPFENVNGDEENRIMAVGIHDDLLAQLSRISSLRVTSRTSVNDYASTDKTLDEIAHELGVQYILEGSVRRSGSTVRVSVTLVDAASGVQLWNDQYDKSVTPDNLFEIQSDIARRVVSGLEAQLTPEDVERLDAMEPASDLAAQSWYYRGLDLYSTTQLDGIMQARDALERAVAIDPAYVAAWATLAQVQSRLTFVGEGTEERARAAMDRTIALAPASLEAHLARGFFEYYGRRNFDAARSAFEAAVRLAPSDAEAAWALALILRRQGEWDQSTSYMKRATQLDPRNSLRLETLGENLRWMGAFEDANAAIERTLAIDPANNRARSRKVEMVIEIDGSTDRARRLAGELDLDPASFEESVALWAIALFDRDYPRALDIAEALEAGGVALVEETRLSMKAVALSLLGDPGAVAMADSVLAIETISAGAEVDHPSRDGYVLALAGRHVEALRSLREGERRVRQRDDYILDDRWAAFTIRGYAALGEIDAGFGLLDDVIERGGENLSTVVLRLDPQLDPYREDPRFDALIARREAFEAEGARKGAAGRPWLP